LLNHRRTPLDDALVGKYWNCAKLLYCFGARHTVELSDETKKALDETSMDDIRAFVRGERVCILIDRKESLFRDCCIDIMILPLALQQRQEKQKETEKHLRDNVKWMMADSETWLKNLEERMGQLDKVESRVFVDWLARFEIC